VEWQWEMEGRRWVGGLTFFAANVRPGKNGRDEEDT